MSKLNDCNVTICCASIIFKKRECCVTQCQDVCWFDSDIVHLVQLRTHCGQ